jgi:enoyl-CoA hydratase
LSPPLTNHAALSAAWLLFSAGADIRQIAALNTEAVTQRRYLEDLCNGVANVNKPLLAAVEGLALGGGFELALMSDLIFASTSSKFGLPEVNIGLIPGAGGTQRLTNAVGKYRVGTVGPGRAPDSPSKL